METILLENFIVPNVLHTEDKQLPDQPELFLSTNDKKETFQYSENKNPIVSDRIDHSMPGEDLPNEALFYQQVNWISHLKNHNDQKTFLLTAKPIDLQLNHPPTNGAAIPNEDLFYQQINWISEIVND